METETNIYYYIHFLKNGEPYFVSKEKKVISFEDFFEIKNETVYEENYLIYNILNYSLFSLIVFVFFYFVSVKPRQNQR